MVIAKETKTRKKGVSLMAIIPQISLFSWSEIENLGDLERLRLVLEYMPDENLMIKLEKLRKNGRDDYPIRAMWNSVLAGIVFQHPTTESLRRELSRNGQLRCMCGFKNSKVPPEWAYTRFLKNLFKCKGDINEIFKNLVESIKKELPDFGKDLAMDSKAIQSLSTHYNKNSNPDGRRDTDADYGKKEYKGIREDGTLWEKVVKWFGYKIHLIVDENYELPVEYMITKASASDIKTGHELVKQLAEAQPEIIEDCETLEADRGYDDAKLNIKLYDEFGIKPVIDTRVMRKEETEYKKNIFYDEKGEVYCYCMETGTKREMRCGGFDKDRNTLKKLCSAEHYGIKCACYDKCQYKSGIRIPLGTDRRIFTPIDRASYKWEKYYDKRTSVERVNSRLDVSFGFENHYIRGMQKMKTRCGLALCVMLAMALGRVKEKRQDLMRSLVKTA